MTDRPDLTNLPSYRPPRRSVFSARRIALMASVVAGLGIAVHGFSPSTSPSELFSSPAHAQVNNEVRKVERPVGFADIVERVKPSVISVKVNIKEKTASNDDGDDSSSPFQPGSPMERFFRRFGGPDGFPGQKGGRGRVVQGQGSGFFISADGFAVTNNHVVDGADKVEVTTDDGKTYTAKVIGTDQRTDLALIKVEGSSNFPFAKLADSKPRIGDWVLAVGNPFGLGGTVTGGHRLGQRPRHRQRSL
ncbi:S1-C subfamily serine protease [Bradyrhizobium japonicum]